MNTLYRHIAFLNDYDDSIVAALIDNGKNDALLSYLKQWDCGEPTHNDSTTPPWGASDEIHRIGDYVLSVNRSLGYAGLCAVETQ